MNKPSITLFRGTASEPLASHERNLPVIDPLERKDPAKYQTAPDLVAAVNVAITLGMPLLVTGEPGCGKSQLAYRVAWELGFGDEDVESESFDGEESGDEAAKPNKPNNKTPFKPHVEKFSVKSTTESSDLFYTFDTIGRFHASRSEHANSASGENADNVEARNFIHFQALGKAMLKALGKAHAPQEIMSDAQWKNLNQAPLRSVVLIDEIDKAPRDVPNDILNEIDDMAFNIPELQRDAPVQLNAAQQQYRPIVIITSNSERDLPEAFLRRCVFYHLSFPPFAQEMASTNGNSVTVESILRSQFPEYFGDEDTTHSFKTSALLTSAAALVKQVREHVESYHKAPSMAEFINCFDFLFKYAQQQGLHVNAKQSLPSLFASELHQALLKNAINQTLFKNHDDMQVAEQGVSAWLASDN